MFLMKESVFSLKEKTNQHWFSYFQIACKYSNSCMHDPLNIFGDDLSS